MQAGAEIGAKAEIAFVGGTALGEAVESGKAGPDAADFVPTAASFQLEMTSSPTYLWISPPASKMASDRSVTKRLRNASSLSDLGCF